MCKAGYYKDGMTCTQCGDNEYTDVPGATSCKVCDSGYTHNETHTDCEQITACDENATRSGEECQCNAGYFGNGFTCTECGDNEISTMGSISCTPCGTGYVNNTTHTDCICPTTKPSLNDDCNETCGCDEGFKCDNGKCIACETGDECSCEDGTWDAEREKCVPTCEDTEKTCSNENDVWCCASGYGCSDTKNQCLSGCEYLFKFPNAAVMSVYMR